MKKIIKPRKIYNLVNWTPEVINSWEKIRRKGKRHFIWFRGVFCSSGFMYFWTAIFFKYKINLKIFNSYENILIQVIICALFGYVLFAWLWSVTEEAYFSNINK